MRQRKGIGKRLLTALLTAAMVLGLAGVPGAGTAARAEDAAESPVIVKNEDGTYDVTFNYRGKAQSVGLRGDIPGTSWDKDLPFEDKGGGSWTRTLHGLQAGQYGYKFVTDEKNWINDPGSYLRVPGKDDNLLYLGEAPLVMSDPDNAGRYRVIFSYAETTGAVESVGLLGTVTWTDWKPDKAIAFSKAEGSNIWRLVMNNVEAGSFEYKFYLNGKDYTDDPANPNNGDNSHLTVGSGAPDYVSPEIVGRDVTFRYRDEGAKSVELMGTVPGADWNIDGSPALERNGEDSSLWEITVRDIPAGRYEYKFVTDNENWKNDPVNSWVDNGNNIFVITGLSAPTGLTVKAGSSLELPAELSLFAQDGTSSNAAVTYELSGKYEGVTLADGKLTVAKGFEGAAVTLTARAGESTVEVTVAVTDDLYTYNIYYYDLNRDHMSVDAAALWLWYDGRDGSEFPFDTTEDIDGRTWLKATVRMPVTEMGVIVRSKGSWDWQTSPNYTLSNSEKLGTVNAYVVYGSGLTLGQVPEVPDEQDRTFYVPGTFPGPSWDAGSNRMTVFDEENGIYSHTFTGVPAGSYEFKISVNASWDENYGVNGARNGGNYSVSVPRDLDVTVYYSDVTHLAVTSVGYMFVDVTLAGPGVPEGTKLADPGLTGIYSATVPLEKGVHSGISLRDGKEIGVYPEFTLEEDRDVTFYYIPVNGFWYCDAVEWDSSATAYYDTKDSAYKSIYGAVPTDTAVTFSVDTTGPITAVEMVVGADRYSLSEAEGAAEGKQRWSLEVSFPAIGEYDYYFVLTQAGGVKVYCDDDGYYGTGVLTDLSSVRPYDLVVYRKDYTTPDWMKNAVIYQIFPDRFFNGDGTNDRAQTSARGAVDYEFPAWDLLPENPEQETAEKREAYLAAGAFWGDGEWSNEIYGGDLAGITQKVEYLRSLGVTVIYLNPVFSSISNHRYDTSDYMKIDPILGTFEDFRELVEAADANGMHVILDGVFNHVSDDSIYFDRYYKFLGKDGNDTVGAYPYWAWVYDHLSEYPSLSEAETAAKEYFRATYNVTDFRYTEWFDISSTAVPGSGDTVGQRIGKPVYSYDGWWGYDSMPVIKSTNGSEYRSGTWGDDIIDGEDSVSRYWLRQGTDGWRLDVANEVSDETWQMFRKAVKEEGDNVIIGEIWDDATKYLMGDMYDSVMNYMFRNAVTAYAKGGSAETAMRELEKLRERYPQEAFYAMMNLVDSHDTSRILSYLDGIDDDRNQKDLASAYPTFEGASQAAKDMQKLVAFLQFTYAGAPTVYYGDERGMAGADDPDDRRTVNWDTVTDQSLLDWYTKLGALRGDYSALRTGSVEPVSTGVAGILGYVRRNDAQTILVLANNAAEGKSVTLTLADLDMDAAALTELITGGTVTVDGGEITVTVPARSGVILTADMADPEPEPAPTPTPSAPRPNVSTATGDETAAETTAKPSASVSSGKATAAVTSAMGDEIVRQAQSSDSATVVIAPQIRGDVTDTEVTIPAATVKSIAEKTDADVRIETPAADVTVPNEALGELAASGKLTVFAGTEDGELTVTVTAGGETVSRVPGGLRVVFELGEGQAVAIVGEDGTETVIPKSLVEDGVATVILEGSATVKLVDVRCAFDDVAEDDWFSSAVDFASGHALMEGSGDSFSPDEPTSRAMLATVLWRIENEAISSGEVAFPDVAGDQWYSGGIAWAGETGVITGYTTGNFEPAGDVTRQEMALMIYRYAALIGLDTAAGADLAPFADASNVAPWASDAMTWCVSTGLFRGNAAHELKPASGATRAEVAAVLQRLIELIVK